MRINVKRFWWAFKGIVTGSLVSAAVFLTFFGGTVDVRLLWQLLIESFISGLCVLFEFNKEPSKKVMIAYMIGIYLYVNIVVLGLGFYFKWFKLERINEVLLMTLCIAIIFIGVWIGCIKREQHLAQKLNDRLKDYQNDDK